MRRPILGPTVASHLLARWPRFADVESVDSMSFLFGGLSDARGNLDSLIEPFVGLVSSERCAGDGRETDPANEHEFVATRNFVQRSRLKIGDESQSLTLTPGKSLNGYDLTEPHGPRLSIKMVGIVPRRCIPQLDDGTPLIFISPALFAENIGLSETLMNVVLRPASTSTPRASSWTCSALAAEPRPGTLIS